MADVNVNREETVKCKPRGKPFEKGNTLGGRKPVPQAFKELAEKYSVPALEETIRIMEDSKEDTRNRLKAIEIILDRGIGKPAQTVDIGNKDGETFKTNNIDFSKFTLEQLRELIENED